MENTYKKVIQWYRNLPEKKKYVEFITAVLSVPVMLTVIIINLNNLNQQKNAAEKQSATEKVTPINIVITGDKGGAAQPQIYITETQNNPTPTQLPTISSCIKDIGPVSIITPRENEVISKDPVCITIGTEANHCSIRWSYKLNNGDWSDFTDKNICLYNLTNGGHTFQLKLKGTASTDEVTLQRSFVFEGNSIVPTLQPYQATASASL